MNFVFFYHSLVSDWNHGNAHFLRGVVSELLARGHRVKVFEPADGWSRENLIREYGPSVLREFEERCPELASICYDRTLNLEKVTAEADTILVHEWNEPWLVNGLAELRDQGRNKSRRRHRFRLLFHDTHHRLISAPSWMKRFRLDSYDGILAFGKVLAEAYRQNGLADSVWTWHEAADIRRFRPRPPDPELPAGDLVWVGNWGDDERSRELEEFLFRPAESLGLTCHLHGVRYPEEVLKSLDERGFRYCGWLSNLRVPEVFANHAVTIHVPRRHYVETLPGIPTIRPFEAMACGIPLVTSPWRDSEGLFREGKDYLLARNAKEMQEYLATLLRDCDFARHLAAHALATIRVHHTCAHRVNELLEILAALEARERKTDTPAALPEKTAHPKKRRSPHATAKP